MYFDFVLHCWSQQRNYRCWFKCCWQKYSLLWTCYSDGLTNKTIKTGWALKSSIPSELVSKEWIIGSGAEDIIKKQISVVSRICKPLVMLMTVLHSYLYCAPVELLKVRLCVQFSGWTSCLFFVGDDNAYSFLSALIIHNLVKKQNSSKIHCLLSQ